MFYLGLCIGLIIGFAIRGLLAVMGEHVRKRRERAKRRKYNLEA